MNIDLLLMTCCGFEDDGRQIRFFLDSPTPELSLTRERGVRTSLFHLCAGADADAVRDYLARHRCWDVMRVLPAYTPERAAARPRRSRGSLVEPAFLPEREFRRKKCDRLRRPQHRHTDGEDQQ